MPGIQPEPFAPVMDVLWQRDCSPCIHLKSAQAERAKTCLRPEVFHHVCPRIWGGDPAQHLQRLSSPPLPNLTWKRLILQTELFLHSASFVLPCFLEGRNGSTGPRGVVVCPSVNLGASVNAQTYRTLGLAFLA